MTSSYLELPRLEEGSRSFAGGEESRINDEFHTGIVVVISGRVGGRSGVGSVGGPNSKLPDLERRRRAKRRVGTLESGSLTATLKTKKGFRAIPVPENLSYTVL